MGKDYAEIDQLFLELRERDLRADDWSRVERLLNKYPDCSRIWDLCGDLMQIFQNDKRLLIRGESKAFESPRECYERAMQLDPEDYLPYESLGFWYEGIETDLTRSAANFKQAIALGNRESSKLGLSRVLAQLGNRSGAIKILEQCGDSLQKQLLLEEIASGNWDPLDDA